MIGLVIDLVVGYSASYLSGRLAQRLGLSFSQWFFGATLIPWIILPVLVWKNVRTTAFGLQNPVLVQVTLWTAGVGWFAFSAWSVLQLEV